jgi:hypothetical protein
MCSKAALAQGGAAQFELRKHRSVNQNGDTAVVSTDPALNSDYISPTGMGWFPGYAINIETGERLNIVFGEDSHLINDNGNDMLFNPTSRYYNSSFDTAVFGGKHYIYVMGHNYKKNFFATVQGDTVSAKDVNMPAYDAGAHFVKEISRKIPGPVIGKQLKCYLWSNAMWVSIPLGNPDFPWLSTDVTVKLRVTKPYERYFSGPVGDANTQYKDNNYWPMYNFSTKAVATVKDSTEKAVSDLDRINVVPNPYYAYSNYETNQLDNRIKIVNLPQKCKITIYSTGGSLIRTFNKDESKTYIDWDLKNFAGIPIAGGVYIIHVEVPGVGEKVVKWFGSLRPVDLNAF